MLPDPEQNADMLTFIEGITDRVQFLLRGTLNSTWANQWFILSEDNLHLHEFVETPDGKMVARMVVMEWDVDGMPGIDVQVTLDANAFGEYSNPYNGFTYEYVEPTVQCDLTISSTAGGSVTTPGEGTFTYDEGTVVNLEATPDGGYFFVNWTGDVGTIADVDYTTTTITMQGDYEITANFEGICFIATAAYGTPMAEEMEVLREFRDQYLVTNPAGEALVELYYKTSPPIANFITEHPALKPVIRAGLVPAVAISTVAVKTTLAEKIAIVSSMVVFSTLLVFWLRRRTGKARRRAN
jgi:hypothetical protein